MHPPTRNILEYQGSGRSWEHYTTSLLWMKGSACQVSLLCFRATVDGINVRRQEDSLIMDGSDESEYCPFELPEDEYGDLMFSRRLAAERSISPATSGRPESRRSTAVDTDGKDHV
jgi:hypothetical protein